MMYQSNDQEVQSLEKRSNGTMLDPNGGIGRTKGTMTDPNEGNGRTKGTTSRPKGRIGGTIGTVADANECKRKEDSLNTHYSECGLEKAVGMHYHGGCTKRRMALGDVCDTSLRKRLVNQLRRFTFHDPNEITGRGGESNTINHTYSINLQVRYDVQPK